MKRRKDKNESPVISPEPNEQNGKLPKQPVRLEPLRNISNDKRMSLHLSSEKVSTPGKLPAKETIVKNRANIEIHQLPRKTYTTGIKKSFGKISWSNSLTFYSLLFIFLSLRDNVRLNFMSLDRNQVSSQRLLVHKEQWKQQSNV